MTKPKRFVGLHAHTSKSLYDGFGSADEHLEFAHGNELDAFSLTDHGTMNGFPEAEQKACEMKGKGKSSNLFCGSDIGSDVTKTTELFIA